MKTKHYLDFNTRVCYKFTMHSINNCKHVLQRKIKRNILFGLLEIEWWSTKATIFDREMYTSVSFDDLVRDLLHQEEERANVWGGYPPDEYDTIGGELVRRTK